MTYDLHHPDMWLLLEEAMDFLIVRYSLNKYRSKRATLPYTYRTLMSRPRLHRKSGRRGSLVPRLDPGKDLDLPTSFLVRLWNTCPKP